MDLNAHVSRLLKYILHASHSYYKYVYDRWRRCQLKIRNKHSSVIKF